jgi:hypothetical protein
MFNCKGIEVENRYWKHNLISLRTEYSMIQNGSIQRTTWKMWHKMMCSMITMMWVCMHAQETRKFKNELWMTTVRTDFSVVSFVPLCHQLWKMVRTNWLWVFTQLLKFWNEIQLCIIFIYTTHTEYVHTFYSF